MLLFLTTSCFPLTNKGLRELKLNDSKQEVIKVMGKPSSTSIHYNQEYLTYYIHNDFIDLFITGKFPFIGFYPFLRTGNKYWVILEDNKLISYGESWYYNIDKDGKILIKKNNKKFAGE